MRLYAESSAVLAWLLGEPRGRETLELLSNAELIIASDLTLVECDRVLIRAVTLEEIDEAEAARRRATLNLAASHWNVLRLQGEVVSRPRRRLVANIGADAHGPQRDCNDRVGQPHLRDGGRGADTIRRERGV